MNVSLVQRASRGQSASTMGTGPLKPGDLPEPERPCKYRSEAAIKFAEWTTGGVLRHAEFLSPLSSLTLH
jgi:hypothetical protein